MNKHKIAAWFVKLICAFGLAAIILPAQAAVPQTLNYQGQLSNAAGVPVNATVSMVFKLYDVNTGGTALWSETQSVTVSNGLYSIKLGQVALLNPGLFGAGLYLGITVETDAEMTPRIALSSAPYAMQSSCTPGDQMDCYTGASSTRNVGACKGGKRNCTSTGWAPTCDGEVLPITEVVNEIDDDCNGVVNNGVGCFIGGIGYTNGAANPSNSCRVCNVSLTTTAWSNVANGTVCDDGSACTTGDTCDGLGTCSGTPSFDDGNVCTTDVCDSQGSVSHIYFEDGTPCGSGQICISGACQAEVCGNGLVGAGETCDDANTTSGDGCSAACSVEVGYMCVGTAPSVCITTCGDGLIGGAEACDDGDTSSGDGCSASCAIEPGYVCSGMPSVCIQ